MKKSTLGILVFFFVAFGSTAQTWVWGAQGTSESDTYPTAADNNGNAFIIGPLDDTISFGNIHLNPGTNPGVYIVKYDTNGNVLWAKQGVTLDYSPPTSLGVTTDNNGNSYMTGNFADTILFGGYALRSNVNGSWTNAYLVKYDVNGNVLWARQSVSNTSPCDAGGSSVATDVADNVILAGGFTHSVSFGGIALKAGPEPVAVAVKYDANGNILWAKQSKVFTSGVCSGGANAVATDNSGYIYVTGQYTDTISFASDTLSTTARGDAFLVKYDGNGNVLWDRSSKSLSAKASCVPLSIITDAFGSVYITGYIEGAVSFGSFTLNGIKVGAWGTVFLVKYSPAGNVLWAKQSYNSYGWSGYSLAVDKYTHIYLSGGSGYSGSSIIFCGDTFNLATSNDPSIIMELDTAGNAICGSIIGTGGDDYNGIACSPDGKYIYLGGDFEDTITFGRNFLNPGLIGEPPFIARWEPCGRQIDTNEKVTNGTCTNIFVPDAFSPNKDGYNDVLYVRSDCIKTIDFIVFDRWGEKVFETTSLNYGWDGTYKGQPMNTGSFVYYLKAQLYNGATIEKKGSVTLVR